jgi:hypothetical protein
MHTPLKSGLVAVLSAALIGAPAISMPESPEPAQVGQVLKTARAQIGKDVAVAGTTIYDGDRLETLEDGTMLAHLGGSQVSLRPRTLAEVHGASKSFSGTLLRGGLDISSPAGQTFELLVNGVTIRPVGGQATVTKVTWVRATQLTVSSERGKVEVSMDGSSNTIEAGSTYLVEIESDVPGPQGSGSGTAPSGRSRRLALFLIAGGVAAATGIILWRALVSPAAP